jgi:antitoxin component of MazEF toxin-antitoxin module
METKVKIERWGDGLGINIPAIIAREWALREGHYVNVQETGHRMIIEFPRPSISYNLNEMLSHITENNLHHSIETGSPTGNEIW